METKIFDYGMNGEGVGKADGKIILIDNALNDETVEIEIIKDNKNYSIAKVINIIEQSAQRQNPPCPYFYKCGGCQLQHMKYAEQLIFKQKLVKKTIKKITSLDVEVKPTVCSSKEFEYRNKMSFSICENKCGLYKNKSYEVVEIKYCPLTDDNINKILHIFQTYINTHASKDIKNLVVRSIENQILVGVVTKNHVDLSNLFSTLSTNFKHIGLYEIINKRKDSVVLSGKVYHVGGLKEIIINNFGLTYSVDLIGFHQINIEIQNKLYESVLNYIDKDDIVINGFSGQGLLTAIIAQKAKFVTGIEINKSSHISAENLKTKNNIKNIKNICGDFFKHIQHEKQIANTIILDPTKKGCGKNVMNEISGIKNIIYISCNPIEFCKDLNVIRDNYVIEDIIPFDMFPNTTNVETLVKLKLKK